MNSAALTLLATFAASLCLVTSAQTITPEKAPPVVVKTIPAAGSTGVDPGLKEIIVTFSKPMADGSWSWVQMSPETSPQLGTPSYRSDQRTCILPVTLKPGTFYVIWLNREPNMNFRDTAQRSAVPYLLSFTTAHARGGEGASGTQSKPNQEAGEQDGPQRRKAKQPSAPSRPIPDEHLKAVPPSDGQPFKSRR